MLNKCIVLLLSLLFVACGATNNSHTQTSEHNLVDCSNALAQGKAQGIMAVPSYASKKYKQVFCKYSKLVAPNGKPIHIYAQAQISNEQMLRAKSILAFYLENVPTSEYGKNKTAVFNAMANNQATLVMFNGSDNGNPPTGGQPLYATEVIIEGSAAYFSGSPRDAAYEEILHLMHDTGIGVDGSGTMTGALPNYQTQIRAAMRDAIPTGIINTGGAQRGLWASNDKSWLKELKPENSLTQEYLASVIDTYYGLAGKASENGKNDLYQPQTREEIQTQDPKGWALMGNFFNPYVTRNVRLSPQFSGTFEMSLDTSKPYTYKSRFLLNIQLLGSQSANINGNAKDNVFTGNQGNNRFDGKGGTDKVIFAGNKAEYVITQSGTQTQVKDTKSNRDGTDTLVNIEKIKFKDTEMSL